MKKIDALMREAVAGEVFPGAVLLFSKHGKIVFHKAYGLANIFTGQPIKPDTVFDLASLTKPLATTPAIMALVQDGRLGLAQRLGSIFSVLESTPKADIQIRHLLCHTAGLPDYRAYYLDIVNLPQGKRKDELRKRIVSEPLVYPVGTKTLYSDIGFMLLDWVVETVSRSRLDAFVSESVYRRFGIEGLFFVSLEGPLPDGDYACTELCPWRGFVLNGVVHDENAYVLGGVSGHAGLFGSAGSTHRLLKELMEGYYGISSNPVFKSEIIRRFLSPCPDSNRALGFDAPDEFNSSCGERFSRGKTVGHLGFTGTSFWMDLQQSVIVILLTNRIHPHRFNERIKTFRPVLHNAVMKYLYAI